MNQFTRSRIAMGSIEAVKIGRDGARTDLGVVAYWHRNPFKRLAWWYSRQSAGDRLMLKLLCALALLAIVIGGVSAAGVVAATVFTHAGKAITTNRILGAGTEPKFVGWGTGAGTAVVGDTTLFTEAMSTSNDGVHNTRVTGTSSRVTTTQANDTYQVVATLTAAAGITITNAGSFDTNGQAADLVTAPAGGNLNEKGDFTGVVLATGEGIQFTMKLQYT